MAAQTGAKIVYGPTAAPSFDAHIALDGEEFKLGNITIKAIHTPGHTMESTCFLLNDENGKETALKIAEIYERVVYWRPNLFELPSGRLGKMFGDERQTV